MFEGFQCTARYCHYILNPDYVAVWLPEMRAGWELSPQGCAMLPTLLPGVARSLRARPRGHAPARPLAHPCLQLEGSIFELGALVKLVDAELEDLG